MWFFKSIKWELVAVSKYVMSWGGDMYYIRLYHDKDSDKRKYVIDSNTDKYRHDFRTIYKMYDEFTSTAVRWAEGCVVDKNYFNDDHWDITDYGNTILVDGRKCNIINELYG